MDFEASPLHAPEPSHLPFGKLMYGCFELPVHFVVTELAQHIKRKILVFQAVIKKVIGRNSALKQVSHFFYHAGIEPGLQSLADATPSFFAFHLQTYDIGLQRGQIGFYFGVSSQVFGNFYGSEGSFGGVGVPGVVPVFVTGQYVAELGQGFSFERSSQSGVFGTAAS